MLSELYLAIIFSVTGLMHVIAIRHVCSGEMIYLYYYILLANYLKLRFFLVELINCLKNCLKII